MFDDFTPGDGEVEWAHSRVHDTFIVDFHHLIPHHHLSQGHFSFFNDNGEVLVVRLCQTEQVSGAYKNGMIGVCIVSEGRSVLFPSTRRNSL